MFPARLVGSRRLAPEIDRFLYPFRLFASLFENSDLLTTLDSSLCRGQEVVQGHRKSNAARPRGARGGQRGCG